VATHTYLICSLGRQWIITRAVPPCRDRHHAHHKSTCCSMKWNIFQHHGLSDLCQSLATTLQVCSQRCYLGPPTTIHHHWLITMPGTWRHCMRDPELNENQMPNRRAHPPSMCTVSRAPGNRALAQSSVGSRRVKTSADHLLTLNVGAWENYIAG